MRRVKTHLKRYPRLISLYHSLRKGFSKMMVRERSIYHKNLTYKSFADLNRDIRRNLHQLPQGVDLVVGIPKSGVIPAMQIALALNCSVTDFDSFVQGRIWGNGRTRTHHQQVQCIEDCRRILLVDDTVDTGATFHRIRESLRASGMGDMENVGFIYMAVYAVPGVPDGLVDLCLEYLNQPRIFEWNYMHHPILKHACVDLDGVLCVDPTEEENDDGENYLTFLKNASPIYLPTKPIGTIVTSRLEKYREPTERWLAEQHVEYDALVMLDLPSKAARQAANAYGQYKADIYRKSKAALFIESHYKHAVDIARLSGRPVLCVETQELLS